MKNYIFRLLVRCFAILCSFVSYSATITVTNTLNSGSGSLRNAISSAASNDIIRFNIAGVAPHIINLSSSITITQNNLTIDASSNPDYTCGSPTVVIDANANFTVQGSGCILKGVSFRNVFLNFDGGDNNQVHGCWFNLDNTGTSASGNSFGASIVRFFNNSTGNIIGGLTCDTRNVFSLGGTSYTWEGSIRLSNGCSGNTFRGNYFGTDRTGMFLLNTNPDHIFYLAGAQNTTFDQNVICGGAPMFGVAAGAGIYCDPSGSVNGLIITGNKVGVRADGTDGGSNAWGNTFGGVVIQSTTCNNLIFTGNIVCRNGMIAGADIKKCGLYTSAASTSMNISNNYVGVTTNFTKAGNYFTGIFINGVCSNVTINGNFVGDNGSSLTDGDQSHGISIEQPCSNVSITNNYIGMSPSGGDIGNYCSGITVSGGNNFIVTGNFIGFNKGMRSTIPNGGMVFTNSTDVVIQNNIIGGRTSAGLFAGQRNMGLNVDGGNGIFISGASAIRYRIGGMSTNVQNYIAYNLGHGIEVQNADFVEMRWNSLYCNGLKGIMLNYGTALSANSSFGNGNVTITSPGLTPAGIGGSRPVNSVVDVFGTVSCASSSSCIAQGEYRYSATYTPSTAGTVGSSWSYANGSAMFNDLSAIATGGSADCNGGYCRSSEFSTCIDNVLPISLKSFTAEPEGQSIKLIWSTIQEINSERFLIQRSNNGIDFITIGEVAASGYSNTIVEYSFNDQSAPIGKLYYRLMEIDRDRRSQYSNITTVSKEIKLDVVLFPNPSNGNFEFTLQNFNGAIHAYISNYQGVVLWIKTFKDEAEYLKIPVSINVASGLYLLSIEHSAGKLSKVVSVE